MPLPRPDGRLTVDRLVYRPPGVDRPVLKGVSFSLEPGETLGIIGPSAAGKSTLARALLNLIPATAGKVVWFEISDDNLWTWASALASQG